MSHRLVASSQVARGQRGGAAVWIIALLVLGGIAFAVYWFAFRDGAGSAQSSNLAGRVLPAEVEVVGGVDLARIVSDSDVRAMLQKNGTDIAALEAELAKHNIKSTDLVAMVFGGRLAESGLKDAIVAVEAKTDTKALAGLLAAASLMAPEPIKSAIAGGRVEALDGGVALTGSNELLDLAIKVAKGAAPALGSKAGLDEIRAALDTGAIFWVASPIPAGSLAMLPGVLTGTLGQPSHFGFSINLGSTTELRAAALLPGKDAEEVASSLDLALGFMKSKVPEPGKTLLENLSLSGKGAVLIAKITLSQQQLEDLIAKNR